MISLLFSACNKDDKDKDERKLLPSRMLMNNTTWYNYEYDDLNRLTKFDKSRTGIQQPVQIIYEGATLRPSLVIQDNYYSLDSTTFSYDSNQVFGTFVSRSGLHGDYFGSITLWLDDNQRLIRYGSNEYEYDSDGNMIKTTTNGTVQEIVKYNSNVLSIFRNVATEDWVMAYIGDFRVQKGKYMPSEREDFYNNRKKQHISYTMDGNYVKEMTYDDGDYRTVYSYEYIPAK